MGNTLKLAGVAVITVGIQWIYPGVAVAATAAMTGTNVNHSTSLQFTLADGAAGFDGGMKHSIGFQPIPNSNPEPYIPPVEDGPERSQGSGTR